MARDQEDARPRVGGRDWLVRWSAAAVTLGRAEETLTAWYENGLVPAVRSPGGKLSAHASWLYMVMNSARPGVAGEVIKVSQEWWALQAALQRVAPPAPGPEVAA